MNVDSHFKANYHGTTWHDLLMTILSNDFAFYVRNNNDRHDRKYRANLQVWKVTDLLDFLERPRKLEKTQTLAM